MLDRILGEPRGEKMVELGLTLALVSLAALIAVISLALG
jgi:Flp pilus assembly pilin Flp